MEKQKDERYSEEQKAPKCASSALCEYCQSFAIILLQVYVRIHARNNLIFAGPFNLYK